MPNRKVVYKVATGARMPGHFLPLQLDISGADLSRVESRSGVSFLFDHHDDEPFGRVLNAWLDGGALYMSGEIRPTTRTAGKLQELDARIRDGCSPGFLINAVSVEEDENNELYLLITNFSVYECTSSAIPRNADAGLVSLDSPPPTKARAPQAPRVAPVTAADITRAAGQRVAQIRTQIGELKQDIDTMKNTSYRPASERVFTAARESGGPPSADSSAGRSPLAAVLRAAHEKPDGAMPHGATVLIAGAQGMQVVIPTAEVGLEKAAVISTTATGARTTEALPGRAGLQSGAGSAERILSLPTVITGVRNDLSIPAISGAATAQIVTEGATIVEGSPTFETGRRNLSPRVCAARLDINLAALVQGGELLEGLLEDELRRATRNAIANQILNGSGAPPETTGILNATGLNAESYTPGTGLSAGKIRATEKHIEDTDSDSRLTWIFSKPLWSASRATLREPGNTFMLERGFVLSDIPAVRSGLLAAGVGICGAFADSTLVWFSDSLLILDRVSVPGQVRLTLLVWWDFRLDLVASFAALRPQ